MSNLFGYILLFIYNIVPNFGIAIILFTVLVKLLLLPLSIKQQRSMQVNKELNDQIQVIQLKYKNNPEKQSEEMMKLYKENKVNPFAGCLVTIIQLVLVVSMFYLVKSPLTKMEKIPQDVISKYTTQLTESGITVSQNYPEIDIIREYDVLKEKFPDDPDLDKVNINMNFFGINLSMIPQYNLNNWKVYIIPALYVVSILISNHMMTKMQQSMIGENKDEKSLKNADEDMMASMTQMNSMMKYMMPIISISIVAVAPLGLALYWLMSNVCMICERLFVDVYVKKEAKA